MSAGLPRCGARPGTATGCVRADNRSTRMAWNLQMTDNMKRMTLAFVVLLLIGIVVVCQEVREGENVERKRDYVVLLHGLGRSHRSMKPMGQALAERGYRVVNHDYPSTREDMPKLVARLARTLATKCPDRDVRIHFVTHSLGGIVVRVYVDRHEFPRIGRVVMLSPPNQGSEIPDTLKSWAPYRWAMGPVGGKLGTGSNDLPQQLGAVAFDVGVITGDRSLNPLYSSWVEGDDDGKVSIENAKVAGMRDFLVVHASHTFIMRDSEVIAQTLHFLKHGRFERSDESELEPDRTEVEDK